ncbi:MAG: DDE transposase family protein [Microcoleaceae cyanobacterium]
MHSFRCVSPVVVIIAFCTSQILVAFMNERPQKFYIIKQQTGTCEILPSEQVEQKKDPDFVERWGPFNSVEEAIARRVGLIRAGICQPK